MQKERYQLLTGQKSSVMKFVESSFTIEHSLCLLSELSMCINTKWCFFDYRPVDNIVLIHRSVRTCMGLIFSYVWIKSYSSFVFISSVFCKYIFIKHLLAMILNSLPTCNHPRTSTPVEMHTLKFFFVRKEIRGNFF